MRRVTGLLALASLLALVSPTTARADGSKSWRVCGGDTFSTCAAVQLHVTGQNVTLQVWNLSGNSAATYGTQTWAGTIYNGIGFYNVGSGVSVVSNSLTTKGPYQAPYTQPGATWQFGSGGNLAFPVDLRAVAPGPTNNFAGIASGCAAPGQLPGPPPNVYQTPCTSNLNDPTGYVTFNFQVNGNWDVNNTDLVLRGFNGPQGQSVECWTGQNGSGGPANCTTVTPEPVTMALLATGLVGMGGAGLIRRRKKNGDIA